MPVSSKQSEESKSETYGSKPLSNFNLNEVHSIVLRFINKDPTKLKPIMGKPYLPDIGSKRRPHWVLTSQMTGGTSQQVLEVKPTLDAEFLGNLNSFPFFAPVYQRLFNNNHRVNKTPR